MNKDNKENKKEDKEEEKKDEKVEKGEDKEEDAEKESEEDLKESPDEDTDEEKSKKGNGKMLLLADDDPLIIRMYQKKLSGDGYRIETAFNGEEAMIKVMKDKPDMILLDVMMPKMNGVETLKRLKSEAKTKSIPVVILTNLGDKDEDVENAKKLGALDFLVKSEITLAELSKKVKSVVGE